MGLLFYLSFYGGSVLSLSRSFEELLNEYLPMIRSIASSFPAYYREDLMQEGSFGLSKALNSYKESLGVPFKFYARACIKNSVYSAYRRLCRNEALDRIDDRQQSSDEMLEDTVIEQKDIEAFFHRLRENLSEMETKILSEYLQDKSYEEIALSLHVSPKTVDNSLFRIKAKIKKLY